MFWGFRVYGFRIFGVQGLLGGSWVTMSGVIRRLS